MNLKKYISLFFILLSTMVYGQSSHWGKFSFTIKFEKNIPIDRLEVLYYTKSNNYFTEIKYKSNMSKNEIEIFGSNNYVHGSQFPMIILSLKQKKMFNTSLGETNNEEREYQKLFYLIIKKDGFDNLEGELIFSNEKPNIIVDYKNNKGIIKWEISNYETYSLPIYEMPISNELVKVKPVE